MKIYSEQSIRNFEFWSGATDRAKLLTDEEMNTIEQNIDELYPDGMSKTQLNDLFWFDFDFICGLIGTDEETIFEERD